ncbi:2-succinyl-5-enolpyruvyl-6-hydroxy-3-cyclohexene-1-carboxylate synthase [Pontibacillus halophilus JSM 076056 = DSM 19796]|uniref:2-succinyl-5-enolpyruvyl-6-hydroxy-3-cyclohexene-1-carboxylate synthase n=1 Tax=Pontibacillus halophilus JSM 076056 = DSM 19796 TaxID=1385510 RepID=A0A0A5GEI2_9BACI|nr:2-succinyl-5-enolpyruvyl-6-hydroxy-3-cyclohexene-1-carboxylic-acid synthase [Pontibacillus halophilus]KGX89515.1 2-succinyl-5-enolpyruvyl-6-hydroxy-3-cyclohexene-1-carboxylate synthase [Pontibacillus halophilus JSM 076056 = DSM 19796]
MNHTERLTRYVTQFVDELVQSGVTDVVISPGSRSTPLAMTFTQHKGIKQWINLDERSAGFFALGMAKEQNRVVALVCTSGTAAANYYPAIVEAYYSRVPLLVLTADRPHELRDVGAPQAIDQIHMFQPFIKWFHEMALPEGTEEMQRYVRSKASRAVHVAQDGNRAAVHLNFPFRSPLVPDFDLPNVWERTLSEGFHSNVNGRRRLDAHELITLHERLQHKERPLFVVGPQTDEALRYELIQLAEQFGVPLLADPLSQVRSGVVEEEVIIETYDAILKSEWAREHYRPDVVVRFGAMPVSKPFMLMLNEYEDIEQWIVEAHEGHREPTSRPANFVYSDPVLFCMDYREAFPQFSFNRSWLETWQRLNKEAKSILLSDKEENSLTEGHVISTLLDELNQDETVYIGNSMAVRDLDTFFMTTDKRIRVLANRGANGIDGMVSSAFGAASHGAEVTLVLGDLSFYHDLNGMLVGKQYGLPLRIIVVNNNGGGIFSFLPQAEQSTDFEELFGTPFELDFEKTVSMYGGRFFRTQSLEVLRAQLATAPKGLEVIEVVTNREINAQWHRTKWREIEETIREGAET